MSETKKPEPAELPTPPEPAIPVDREQDGPPSAPAPKPRGGRLLASLAILLALGAGGAAAYLWQQLEQARSAAALEQQALEQQLAQVENATRQQTEALDRALQNSDEALRQRQSLKAAIDNLRTRLARDRGDWAIAEVDYLLTIANRRLRLERDLVSALAALQEADQRLLAINDPAFTPVREAIAGEIQALREVPAVDRSGLALQIGTLVRGADTLPVNSSLTAPGETSTPVKERPPVSNWREFLSTLWADIRSLVTIREGEAAAPPLLPPDQRYFLHQNLALKLETARLALLQRQAESYRSALEEAGDWVQQYFDTEDPRVQAYLESLRRLARITIAPELPDISDSLRRLRQQTHELASPAERAQ